MASVKTWCKLTGAVFIVSTIFLLFVGRRAAGPDYADYTPAHRPEPDSERNHQQSSADLMLGNDSTAAETASVLIRGETKMTTRISLKPSCCGTLHRGRKLSSSAPDTTLSFCTGAQSVIANWSTVPISTRSDLLTRTMPSLSTSTINFGRTLEVFMGNNDRPLNVMCFSHRNHLRRLLIFT